MEPKTIMKQRDTILIVDDMVINRTILRSLFERTYNILEAENGEQALLLLNQFQDNIEVMLLDLVMPVKNGYQVMEEMGRTGLLSKVPVVVITSDDTAEIEVKAFDMGASDIIMKPFEPHVVKRRIQNIAELNGHKQHLEKLVEEQSAKLRESNAVIIDALSSVIEYRSLESGQHIKRIRLFTKILLEEVARSYHEYDLDARKIEIIADASSMHDIGKIAIPDAILNKPGRLTPEEFDIMKTHTVKGCEMLSHLNRMNDKEYIQYAYNICRYHHERFDGSGYPDGLKGNSIPICAQVVAIADCYDALTTDRVYKDAIPQEQAFIMILNGECGEFSPRLLECFKNVREAFTELSREYRDGRSLAEGKKELYLPPEEYHSDSDGTNTLELGQMKYLALLRCMDSTVMEVDLNTGIYHIIYMADRDFEPLRSGKWFEDAIRSFAKLCVHPDDRDMFLRLLGSYMEEFFTEGFMKQTRKYRIHSQMTGEYYWCEASLLRVDIENPRQRKVMLTWSPACGRETDSGALPVPLRHRAPGHQEMIINEIAGGIRKCLNDQWLTIVDVNYGFLEMSGYAREEIGTIFHNRFIEIVHPADRDKLMQQIRQQLNAGSAMEVEYRIRAKDGRTIWVLDKSVLKQEADGRECIYCILVNITQSRQAQEELRLTLERHKIILDQTNDIIFEWDIKKDQLLFSGNWEKKYGYKPITESVSTAIPMASRINPEDMPKVVESIHDIMTGVPYKEVEIRLAQSSGRYRWNRCRLTTQFDEMGKPFKAVGVFIDIDNEKRAAKEMQEKTERDALTKLYNRNASRKKINSYLEHAGENQMAAMMIIDIDDFKMINDQYGHMFGDAVLTEMAAGIAGLFRERDVVSRIGGDEFLVFMPDIPSKDVVRERTERMLETFQGLFSENEDGIRLSCSIGIAVSPFDGTGFQELFQCSDVALYKAKTEGKNCYTFFDEDTMERSFGMSRQFQPAVRIQTAFDNSSDGVMANVIRMTFQKLYVTGDFNTAISSILELVGQQFSVSRVYIFEGTRDGKGCSNTYEWCRDGISPLKASMQEIPYIGTMGDYRESFDENGVFYCQDVAKVNGNQLKYMVSPDALSVLQCAVLDNGIFNGYVGFDDYAVHRMWTREQINSLVFLSKILSIFLFKKRAQDQMMEAVQNLRSILDSQNSWIYVVNPHSYELWYVNKKAHEAAPEAVEGTTCYKAFFNRDEPCETCPMRESHENGSSSMEIYNPYLKVLLIVDSSAIRWGNQKAVLMACHNITKYKEGS